MDFKRLAAKNAEKAFELAKSMGVAAVFSGGSSGGFDFAAGAANSSTTSQDAMVIPLSEKRDRDGNKIASLMVREVDIRAYSVVTFNGYEYKVGALTQDNGVIKVFEAIRGA